jgi:hypothetical protein
MSYKFNPFTGTFDISGDNAAISAVDLDGGFANSTYLPVQLVDGGDANG